MGPFRPTAVVLALVLGLMSTMVRVSGTMRVEMGPRYGLDVANAKVPMADEARRHILAGVQQDKADSLYLWGLMHYYGHGVHVDMHMALRYMRLAARKRHLDATFTLGMLHHDGLGDRRCDNPTVVVPQDDALAYAYLQPAASAGHADAQWLLGTLLNHGRGVPMDMARAAELFTASTHQGNPRGAFHLGTMHEYGRSVPRNWTKAASLYETAAAHDVPEALYYLGLLHAYGRGVALDHDRAFELFQKASSLGYAPATYYLGVWHVSGPRHIDYEAGLRYFEAAALANDASISTKALTAASELKTLLASVEQRQKDAYAHYVLEAT